MVYCYHSKMVVQSLSQTKCRLSKEFWPPQLGSTILHYQLSSPPLKKTTIFSCMKFLCFFPHLTGIGERLGRVLDLSQLLVSTPYIMRADSHKGFALKLHDSVFQHRLVASNYPDTELKEKQRSMSPIRNLQETSLSVLVHHPPCG